MIKAGNVYANAGAAFTGSAGWRLSPFRRAAAVTLLWLGAFGLGAYTMASPGMAPSGNVKLLFALFAFLAFPLLAWFVSLSRDRQQPVRLDAASFERDLAELERRIDALGVRIQNNRHKVAETLKPAPVRPAAHPRKIHPVAAAKVIDLAAKRMAKGLKPGAAKP